MAGSPRARLRAILGVLAALGLLLLVGRLPIARLGSPATTTSSTLAQARPVGTSAPTTQPLGIRHLAFHEGIGGLAVTGGAVWVAHGTTISRVDPRPCGRPPRSPGTGSARTSPSWA